MIDLDDFGHRYVVGAAGQRPVDDAAHHGVRRRRAMSVADLHLYALDCGNGALTVLNELPHTGAVVQRGQAERAKRLLTRLQAELGRRQQVLAAGNYASVTEQRELAEPGTGLPRVLVLIDRWESFMTTYGEIDSGTLVEIVQELLRDGASAGIHLLIAGDRQPPVEPDERADRRLPRAAAHRPVRLRDGRHQPQEAARGDPAGSGLPVGQRARGAGGDPRQRPIGTRPDGRRPRSWPPRSGSARGRGARDRVRSAWTTCPPRSPWTRRTSTSARRRPSRCGRCSASGGDDLTAFGMDLAGDAPAFLVAGPSKSGRSTMLAVMTESLLRGGTQVVILAPRPSVLRDFAGRDGVRAVLTGAEVTEEELAPHLDPDGTPVVLVVDDGELVADAPAKTWLRAYLRTAADNRRGLILGGDASEVAGGFSGWQVDVKKSRRGALLSPQDRFDGDLVGASLARSAVSTQVSPGKALVHLGSGELMTVLVPTL